MTVFVKYGESGMANRLAPASLHPEIAGLAEKVKNLRRMEDTLKNEAPGFLAMRELVQSRKLAELELFCLTRKAIARLEAPGAKQDMSDD